MREQNDLKYFMLIFIILGFLILTILATGCVGPKGSEGNQGVPGLQGPIGTPVPVYTKPATQSECANGGVDITVGSTTTTICDGLNGSTGVNGVNATPIEFIQFCEGFTPTYPDTFPEYGILDGTSVYGVYSANGGFLALLPPGQYSSNGINASCTFTINLDGSVTE